MQLTNGGIILEVATISQLPSINEAISRRRHYLFGHVRRMDQAVPVHQALRLSVTSWQGSGELDIWRRQPGRPRKCWVEPVTTCTGLSPSDAWSVATDRSAWRASTVKRRERQRERERERERQTDRQTERDIIFDYVYGQMKDTRATAMTVLISNQLYVMKCSIFVTHDTIFKLYLC